MKNMFDVRSFHTNAPNYESKILPELYKLHETSKIREYQLCTPYRESQFHSSRVRCTVPTLEWHIRKLASVEIRNTVKAMCSAVRELRCVLPS
jgi:hypothetical protein